jgi:glycine/D-amino acid oxidase-like deaminating enzyme
MNTAVVDYIIVGQGLAGSCLAVELLNRKKKIAVIDFPMAQAASRVAAGLFNPVTGKKLSLTWLADELFPHLHKFYKDVERITDARFYFPMPVYRPFVSAGEQNEWMGRDSDFLSQYVEKVYSTPAFESQVINPYGGLLVKQCGYLDTIAFLTAIRNLVAQQGILLEEWFDEQALTVYPEKVSYRNLNASQVIFCTGVSANQSRFFSWLPIKPLKGEVLQLQADEVVPRIYNRGVYAVPGVWKAGATYNRFDGTTGVTPDALAELTNGLRSLIRFPYKITGQLWGFRPTVPDRRPILGIHPHHKNIIIFNGLGTKGVSLAPYFARQLVQWLENGHGLNNAVDIQRYKSVYWKSA